jgi:TolB-like protein/tRNA A-37 threonylcarbamoyl transferase component Bud32/cytochrome c-type biogenesis protein CcmH/NrfG
MELVAQHKICGICGSSVELEMPSGFCPACLLTTALERSQTLAAGSSIEDYELLNEIARGGMGIVYRARQRTPSRVIALKMILPTHLNSLAAVQRFRDEAEAAASLDHEGILPIYAIGEHDGAPFYSMKFAEGGALSSRIDDYRDKPREAAALIAKIARAVDFAHKHGILHRDLKPGNVLFDSADKPYVSDFGLAKWLQGECDLTQTLAILGTPFYMAPEQAKDSRGVTAAADIYSLGAILYHLLMGRPPFTGDTPMEVLQRGENEPAPRPRLTNRSVSVDLETICLKCLEKDPGWRYPSAAALAEDLDRFCTGRTIQARRTGIFSRGRKWVRRNPKLMATGVAGLLVGAAMIWLSRAELFRAPQFNPPEKSIAVLPFVDLSQAKDQEYFCDGMSEEILHALANVDGLRVAGRTSSFSFRGKDANTTEVGRKLNVGNVLQGSVRRDGNRVRITTNLINTRSGFHVWAETYDRELAGVFALQDEITRSIVEALKIKLAGSLPTQRQRDTEIYDLYLQGLYFSNKSSEEDLRRALSFFQRAVEKDPTFARAWTGIAKVWYFLADVYVRPLDAYPASREAALKALALDDKDAEAHCYLGEAKRVLDWDLAGADAELKRALELDPNSAPAHFFSALHPLFRGELKEGLQLILDAERLDPVSPITSYVATAAYLANGRIDDAIVEGQRTLQLDPNYFYLDSVLAAAYREKGNFPEAIALYTKAQEATQLPSSGLAVTYTRMGRDTETRNILTQLLQVREKRYVSAPLLAAVCTALGDKEKAFEWLETAYAEHSGVLQWIAFLPEFRALHSDGRFPQLLRRITASQDKILAITETTLSEVSDPKAQSHFALKIGVKARPGTKKGVATIAVSFYDRTKDNKIKPTDARTSYSWLTASQDWTDPTPKFLAAHYVRSKMQSRSTDDCSYGGFIVRVYFGGQLQDARANPPELLTAFPALDQLAP